MWALLCGSAAGAEQVGWREGRERQGPGGSTAGQGVWVLFPGSAAGARSRASGLGTLRCAINATAPLPPDVFVMLVLAMQAQHGRVWAHQCRRGKAAAIGELLHTEEPRCPSGSSSSCRYRRHRRRCCHRCRSERCCSACGAGLDAALSADHVHHSVGVDHVPHVVHVHVLHTAA